MKPGLLLFAHGARDPNWALPFEAVARRIRESRPGMPVVLAYLEFMSPDLGTAGASLAGQGCDHVDVVPLFLGAGSHVRLALPVLVAKLSTDHAGVRWKLQPPIGETDMVVQAMAAAAIAMVDGTEP